MGPTERLMKGPPDRLAERVSAACYGTVLVLAALVVIDADDVGSGLGWELVTGVGLATFLAHLYAEVVGDHLFHGSVFDRREIRRAAVDGLPILLAAVPPGMMLLLGRIDVLEHRAALWVSVAVAVLQLVGVGVLVGLAVSPGQSRNWSFPAITTAAGLGVVTLKLFLSH